MTTSSSKEIIDCPRHDVAIEIYKISTLDTSDQILTSGKVLDDHVFDTLQHFCQTNN